jgi:hypothetical protein
MRRFTSGQLLFAAALAAILLAAVAYRSLFMF